MSEPAMQRLKISREGIILIKSFEGFRPHAVRRDDGGWVIGYGHTLSAREGGVVSEQDAELLLQYDLIPVAKALNAVSGPLNQHQFDALASFAFSVGLDRFKSSDVLSRLTAGSAGEAADAMVGWADAEPVDSPSRRRAAERALFMAEPGHAVALADLLLAPLPSPSVPPEARPESTIEASDPRAIAAAVTPDTVSAPEIDAETAAQPPSQPHSLQRYSAYSAPIIGPLPGVEDGEPLVLTPLDENDPVSAPNPITAQSEADAESDAEQPPLFEDDGAMRVDAHQVIRHENLAQDPRRFAWREIGLYVVMSAFGLLTFGLSVAAFRRASLPSSGSEFMTIAWVLAIFGIVCIAVSAWNLYRKLGRSED